MIRRPLVMSMAGEPVMSPGLAGLFPAGVVAAELRGSGDPQRLLPEEIECLDTAMSGSSAEEFAAGWQCAHRALAELGVIGFPLRVADQQTVWPFFIVGSITHASGFSGAAIAPRQHYSGVGLDTELVRNLSPSVISEICAGEEAAWMDALPRRERLEAAALILSAKEAFFKSQNAIADERLDFGYVEICAEDWAQRRGNFAVLAHRQLALDRIITKPWVGRYRFHEGYVSAGIALPTPD